MITCLSLRVLFMLRQEGVDPFSPCLAESCNKASDAKSSYEKVLHLCVKAGLNALS